MQYGWGAMRLGDYQQARKWLEECIVLYTELNSPMQIGITISGLGEVNLRLRHREQAVELLNNVSYG